MSWKESAACLTHEVYALYFAVRDPRVPWYAKALAGSIAAYAFSPIELIPHFIPVLGYIDDLILIPLGVLLVRRLIPGPVLSECRARAIALSAKPRACVCAVVMAISPPGG